MITAGDYTAEVEGGQWKRSAGNLIKPCRSGLDSKMLISEFGCYPARRRTFKKS